MNEIKTPALEQRRLTREELEARLQRTERYLLVSWILTISLLCTIAFR
jgi:hypothetical protein